MRLAWIIILGGILIALALWSLQRATPPMKRLSDGSVVALRLVTYGPDKVHRYVQGKPWQKILYHLLPNKLKSVSGCLVGEFSGFKENRLVLWTERVGAVATKRTELCLVTVDDHGFEFAPAPSRFSLQSSPEDVVEAWAFRAFPRRGPYIGLRIYSRAAQGGWERVAEFMTRNLDPGPHPSWVPFPLPATRRFGPFQCTLLDFAATTNAEQRVPTYSPTPTRWTKATCRFSSENKPLSGWAPHGAVLKDATGNVWNPNHFSATTQDDLATFTFETGLFPNESALNLRLEMARSAHAHFPPEDLWQVSGLRVPLDREFTLCDQAVNRRDAKFQLVALGAANAEIPGTLRLSPDPELIVRVSPGLPEGSHLDLVRIIDDQGRTVELASEGQMDSNGGLERYFGLRLPMDSKSLDVTFAIHNSLFFEFFVRPQADPQDSNRR